MNPFSPPRFPPQQQPPSSLPSSTQTNSNFPPPPPSFQCPSIVYQKIQQSQIVPQPSVAPSPNYNQYNPSPIPNNPPAFKQQQPKTINSPQPPPFKQQQPKAVNHPPLSPPHQFKQKRQAKTQNNYHKKYNPQQQKNNKRAWKRKKWLNKNPNKYNHNHYQNHKAGDKKVERGDSCDRDSFEDEEEIHFCPHLFDCTLLPEKHPWLYHICEWDKRDCSVNHGTNSVMHFENDPCPYGMSCQYLEDPEHRAHFYHKGYPLYMKQCKDGLKCCRMNDWNHIRAFQHRSVPFELKISGGIPLSEMSAEWVLCYRSDEDVYWNEEDRLIVHDIDGDDGTSGYGNVSNEIIDICDESNGETLIGWKRYHLHNEIICKNRVTNEEYLLEDKYGDKFYF